MIGFKKNLTQLRKTLAHQLTLSVDNLTEELDKHGALYELLTHIEPAYFFSLGHDILMQILEKSAQKSSAQLISTLQILINSDLFYQLDYPNQPALAEDFMAHAIRHLHGHAQTVAELRSILGIAPMRQIALIRKRIHHLAAEKNLPIPNMLPALGEQALIELHHHLQME